MTDLATKIRNAAELDGGQLHKNFRVETNEGYFIEPSLHYQFIQGAKYQHAQNKWAFEALALAVGKLEQLKESVCVDETLEEIEKLITK
jgi:hypothetical protein